MAELSPIRALLALVVTLGFGTSAAVAVAAVGGPLQETAEPRVIANRPLSTASRDAERPEVAAPDGQATQDGSPAAKTPEAETSRPGEARVGKTPSATGQGTSPTEGQQAPVTPDGGSSTSSTPFESGSASPGNDGSASTSPTQRDSSTPSTSPDDVPPDTDVTARYPQGDAAVFTFGADEPASYTCALDGADFIPCDSPSSYSDLQSGWHSFAVRATDGAGNVDPTPAEVRWHANSGVLDFP